MKSTRSRKSTSKLKDESSEFKKTHQSLIDILQALKQNNYNAISLWELAGTLSPEEQDRTYHCLAYVVNRYIPLLKREAGTDEKKYFSFGNDKENMAAEIDVLLPHIKDKQKLFEISIDKIVQIMNRNSDQNQKNIKNFISEKITEIYLALIMQIVASAPGITVDNIVKNILEHRQKKWQYKKLTSAEIKSIYKILNKYSFSAKENSCVAFHLFDRIEGVTSAEDKINFAAYFHNNETLDYQKIDATLAFIIKEPNLFFQLHANISALFSANIRFALHLRSASLVTPNTPLPTMIITTQSSLSSDKSKRSIDETEISPNEDEAGVLPNEDEAGVLPNEDEAGVLPNEDEAGVLPNEDEAEVPPNKKQKVETNLSALTLTTAPNLNNIGLFSIDICKHTEQHHFFSSSPPVENKSTAPASLSSISSVFFSDGFSYFDADLSDVDKLTAESLRKP